MSEVRAWELAPPSTGVGLAEWQPSVGFEEAGECPLNPQHLHGRWPELLSVLLTSRKINDFVWTWYHDLLIQDRVRHMFEGQGFTGYEVRPVIARMKRGSRSSQPGKAIPPLWKVVVRGWGGMATEESGVRLIERCPACNRQKYTAYSDASRLMDERQWDGSDFFMIWPLPRHIFVTDRVARFIKEMKLTGGKLTPLDELQWPSGIGFDCTPGRLRDWMPDERARELGEPLGIY